MAFEKAEEGKTTAMICSGDAGVYGMSGLMLEIGQEYPDVEVECIPAMTMLIHFWIWMLRQLQMLLKNWLQLTVY